MDYSLLIGLHTLSDEEFEESRKKTAIDHDINNNGFLFYKDFNGFQSSFEDGSSGPEVYYLGKQVDYY